MFHALLEDGLGPYHKTCHPPEIPFSDLGSPSEFTNPAARRERLGFILRPRRKDAAQASPKAKAEPMAIPVMAPGERDAAPPGGASPEAVMPGELVGVAGGVPVVEALTALRGPVAL